VVVGSVLVSVCDKGSLMAWDLDHASLAARKHRQAAGAAAADVVAGWADALRKGAPPARTARVALGDGFACPSAAAHPDTYLNKVLVGSRAGRLGLWNVRSGKRVHLFASVGGGGGAGKGAVTTIAPSPALDVCAVGYGDGSVDLLHLKQDVALFTVQCAHASPATSLAFRTDAGTGEGGGGPLAPTLVSGHADGRCWVWALDSRRLLGEVAAPLGAHGGSVLAAAFLPREPVLLTLGADNSLKAWVFDGHAVGAGTTGSGAHAGSAGCRLLRSREGHALPPAPRAVRWYHGGGNGGGGGVLASAGHGDDATALQLLSGGRDRCVRSFHAVRDALSRELSQGHILAKARRLNVRPHELKLRPVVALASSEARSRDWSDVVTAHDKDSCVYVWRFEARAMGPHELKQPHWPVSEMGQAQNPNNFASAVCISVCGSFALVGTHGGVVYRYNLQSGACRGAYPSGAFKSKLNYRKIEAGDVRQTVKKMKLDTQGPRGPLRNASGALVHGKRGVGYAGAKGGGGGGDFDDADDDEEEDEENEEDKGGGGGRRAAMAVEAAADEAELAFAKSAAAKHSGRVTGVAVDALNRTVLTSSLDGTLRFWSFAAQGLSLGGFGPRMHRSDAVKQLGSPVGLMQLVRDAGLVACAGDDGAVRVLDIESRRIVRRLAPVGPAPPLTDMAFAPDARRLYSTAHDGSLRVWDLPTGKCVDWVVFSAPKAATASKGAAFKAAASSDGATDDEGSDPAAQSSDDEDDEEGGLGPATSVSVCPTGEFVCTAHANSNGLHLWTGEMARTLSKPTLVPLTGEMPHLPQLILCCAKYLNRRTPLSPVHVCWQTGPCTRTLSWIRSRSAPCSCRRPSRSASPRRPAVRPRALRRTTAPVPSRRRATSGAATRATTAAARRRRSGRRRRRSRAPRPRHRRPSRCRASRGRTGRRSSRSTWCARATAPWSPSSRRPPRPSFFPRCAARTAWRPLSARVRRALRPWARPTLLRRRGVRRSTTPPVGATSGPTTTRTMAPPMTMVTTRRRTRRMKASAKSRAARAAAGATRTAAQRRGRRRRRVGWWGWPSGRGPRGCCAARNRSSFRAAASPRRFSRGARARTRAPRARRRRRRRRRTVCLRCLRA